MPNYKSCIVLLTVHFFILVNVYSQSKPLKVYEKDGITLKSYNFDGLQPFLNQKNDTLYVINFWATWCVPCVKELPIFEKINNENIQATWL